jgi:hypothetical protein
MNMVVSVRRLMQLGHSRQVFDPVAEDCVYESNAGPSGREVAWLAEPKPREIELYPRAA